MVSVEMADMSQLQRQSNGSGGGGGGGGGEQAELAAKLRLHASCIEVLPEAISAADVALGRTIIAEKCGGEGAMGEKDEAVAWRLASSIHELTILMGFERKLVVEVLKAEPTLSTREAVENLLLAQAGGGGGATGASTPAGRPPSYSADHEVGPEEVLI